MSDEKLMPAPFRIAFREEGQWLVCYLAAPETMQGAEELGRIRMSTARIPATRQGFIELMREAVGVIAKVTIGAELAHTELVAAPEHERAGRG